MLIFDPLLLSLDMQNEHKSTVMMCSCLLEKVQLW